MSVAGCTSILFCFFERKKYFCDGDVECVHTCVGEEEEHAFASVLAAAAEEVTSDSAFYVQIRWHGKHVRNTVTGHIHYVLTVLRHFFRQP